MKSNVLVSQEKISVNKEELREVVRKASQAEMLISENGALEIQLHNTEKVVSEQDTIIKHQEATIKQLAGEVEDLKSWRYYTFCLIIGFVIVMGIILYFKLKR